MSNLQIIISMKRLKLPTYKIFSFEGLDLDSLYETHLSLNYTKAIEHDDNAVVKSIIKQVEGTIPIDNNKPIPRKKELIEKYQYFIHLLITRSFMKGYNTFNSEFLQDLFGSSYFQMIMTLIHLGHISRSPIYEIGKSARTITLINENIICRTKYDSSFEKYRDKHLALMKSEQKRKIDSISKEIGVDFLNQYKRNVRKLKIVDETSARLFIDTNTETSNYQKQSYQWIIDKYINKEFEISTDNDNRIYSVLTYTHKDLKNFINIKYQLDINNSHPLLFSYYIIMKYNISHSIIYLLYNIDININTITSSQYDTNVFRKLLKDNDIEYTKTDGVKFDHLFYIYLTFHGKFWDLFLNMEINRDVPRHTIKEELFKEVYYSKILGGRKMNYATQFKQVFPNVYQMILNHRKEFREGKQQHLAHKMMSLESEIFQKIMKKMYAKCYAVINIHDALVVLDTEENIHLFPNEVEGIIKEEYLKYNLYSTCKVDRFNF